MSYDPEIFPEPKGQLGKLKQKREAGYEDDIFKTVEKHADFYDFKKYPVGEAGLPQAVRDTAGQFSPLTQAAVGSKAAVDNAALRAKQIFSELTPEDVRVTQANRALLGSSPSALIGNALTQGAALGPIAGTGLVSNAAVSAGQGLLGEPVLPGEDVAGMAVKNALYSVPATLGGRLLTGSPLISEPTAQTRALYSQGVVPTIGQNAASSGTIPGKILSKIEEGAASIPLVGSFIEGSRRRAVGEFNKAAMNRAMPPGGAVTSAGPEGLQQAKDAVGAAYDKVYQGVQVMPDAALTQGLNAAKISTALPLNRAQAKAFDDAINRNLWEKLPKNAPVEAGLVKMEIESKIGEAGRAAFQQGDKSLGDALMNARNAVRDWLNRNVGASSKDLPALNQARANRAALDSAVERAKAQSGIFTPYQLQAASRPGSEMRTLADQGQAVLKNTLPNSGTTDRALNAMFLGAESTPIAASYFLGMPYLSALALGPLAYTRTGSAYLQGLLTPEALQRTSPLLGQGIRAYETQQ